MASARGPHCDSGDRAMPPVNRPASPKRAFDIDEVMARVGEAVKRFPLPSMFQLRAEGYASPFEQLVACIVSIRTYDEVSLPVARRLFAVARTPDAVAALAPARIDELIHDCTFHDRKAIQIHAIAETVRDVFGGELPCDDEIMRSFAGVGPKCANLALGIACGAARIPVDIHVHRVTNRWGYVQTRTPEQTLDALGEMLPERYHVEINRRLVPFGKFVCTGIAPKCSTCPILEMCRQVGVTTHR